MSDTKARRRRFGVLACVAVVATGTTLALAVPAQAYSGSATLGCKLYSGDTGSGSSANSYTDNFTLTQVVNGANTDVTLSATTGPNGGPVGVAANSEQVIVTAVTADNTTVTLSSGQTYPPTAYVGASPGTPLGPYTTTGSYAGAPQTLTVTLIKFDDNTTAYNADSYCSGTVPAVDPKASPTNTTIVDTPAPPPEVPEVPALVLIPLIGAAVFGGGYLITRRRSNQATAAV